MLIHFQRIIHHVVKPFTRPFTPEPGNISAGLVFIFVSFSYQDNKSDNNPGNIRYLKIHIFAVTVLLFSMFILISGHLLCKNIFVT